MRSNRWLGRALCIGTALAIIAVPGHAPAQTPQPLRVCADPNYMPYSNRAGDGFENKIAKIVGQALGRPVEYYWTATRESDEYGEYLHRTIEAGKCDLLVDVPYAMVQVETTRPYYIASYIFLFKRSAGYDLTSLDSPVLHSVKIGYEAETPVEDGLKLRALTIGAKPFKTADDPDESPGRIVSAVEAGQINVGLTWDPAVGYFLKAHPDLTVVTIPNGRSQGSPEQYSFPMAMATRSNDPGLHAQVEHVIATHEAQLEAVLHQYNIRFFAPGEGV
jgi:mxaJ protein